MSGGARGWLVVLVLTAVPIAGALAGRFAGPALARTHRLVRVADRIAVEESGKVADRTNESKAFRGSGGSIERLRERAGTIEEDFRLGGAVFGAWCGLVVVFKTVSFIRRARRTEYDVDQAACLSCGRCYKYCPVERQEWKKTG